MKFWDDSLRVCPKCKINLNMRGEEKAECPHCNSTVLFFNFKPIGDPPEIPESQEPGLWKNPTTTALLIAISVLGLVSFFAIYNRAIIAVISTMSAIGFGAFAFLRHAEAKKIEDSLAYMDRMRQYGEIMRNRVKESASRYNALLQTGDSRIEHYCKEIYGKAEQEKRTAEEIRATTRRDRKMIGSVEQRIFDMAERFVYDHLKWWTTKVRPDPDNYQRNKLELKKAFDFVDAVGYDLPRELRKETFEKLKQDYKKKVHEQALKDHQKRINQQMREEEKLRKEQEQKIQEAEGREREIKMRLDEMLRAHKGIHDAEVEGLERQLAEARAETERKKSMAQQTKKGYVYILSNIGAFGENVYKVGMTRREEPEQRVKELSDASVPFPFDVHAMFSCENAPSLENALHHELTRYRVNRVNLRKEFFNVDLDTIVKAVRTHHDARVEYVAKPEALQYRESLNINPEDLIAVEEEMQEINAELGGELSGMFDDFE